jgi:hypothetical protein
MAHTILYVLENTVDGNKITDSRIFNMEETSHKAFQLPEKSQHEKANIKLEPFYRANEDRT